MSSAIHNLQKAICGDHSITQLLRQTKLIAVKLSVEDVERWVSLELNGYPQNIQPPQYRRYHSSRLEILNPARNRWQSVTNFEKTVVARQPIAEIEHYAKSKQINFLLKQRVPINKGPFGAKSWQQRYVVLTVQFRRILERVTNNLLDWTCELEKRGIKGDDMSFNDDEKKSAENVVFNIATVHGNVGNVTVSNKTLKG